jgi:hypothetical protein
VRAVRLPEANHVLRVVRSTVLLSLAASVINCGDQPKPNCLTSTASFATKLIEMSRTGACEGQGVASYYADPLVGFSAYYKMDGKGQPDYAKGSLAVRTAEIGTLSQTADDYDVKNTAPDASLYSLGDFSVSEPNDDDICPVPTMSPTHLVLAAVPEVPDDPSTPDDDESFAGQPAVDITLVWSNVRVYVTAASFGTQVDADLTDTRVVAPGQTCTIKYKTLSLSPAVSCQVVDDDGAPMKAPDGTYMVDPTLCSPEPDPAMGRFTGSGISPNTKFECNPQIGYCVLATTSVPGLQ